MKLTWRGVRWVRQINTKHVSVIRAVVRATGPDGVVIWVTVLPWTHAPLASAISTKDLAESLWSQAWTAMNFSMPSGYYRLQPVDTVPWEIHAIEDPAARKLAKQAFKYQRRQLRKLAGPA